MYFPSMSFTSGAHRLQLLIGMSLMTVQFGSTGPRGFHGPRRDGEEYDRIPLPVEKTKYFLLAAL